MFAAHGKFFCSRTSQSTGLNCSVDSSNNHLKTVNGGLIINKLSRYMDKTVYSNLKLLLSVLFYINNLQLVSVSLCKYLGVYFDSKLSLYVHKNSVRNNSREQRGLVSKTHHYFQK